MAPVQITAEQNSIGQPIIEQLRRDGLPIQPFTTTNASKSQAIEALALAFERGDIRIPNDAVLVGELVAYQAERDFPLVCCAMGHLAGSTTTR